MGNFQIVEKRKRELGKHLVLYLYVIVSYHISGKSKSIGLNVSKRLYHTKKEEVLMFLLDELEHHERY